MFSINRDVPLVLSLVFMAGGLAALSYSADRFVESAARLARALGVSPMIVGMVIIGFGTSAPELAVSVLSAAAGQSDLSLGNAYGSCSFNLAAILGVTAMIAPVAVKPSVVFVSGPLLLGLIGLSHWMVKDMAFSRANGFALLALFALVMPLYCWWDQKSAKKGGGGEAAAEEGGREPMRPLDWAAVVAWLLGLVVSSHLLVWGCVDFARDVLGVSPLLIGLTIVAVGTSLPELASAVASARRGEHEFVIGNIVGSNLFNSLGVVGLAGSIQPFGGYSPYVVARDLPMMAAMTLLLMLFGVNWRNFREPGRIVRAEGVLWCALFAFYLAVMALQETGRWKPFLSSLGL